MMWDAHALVPPSGITALEEATRAVGFTMRADTLTLNLLRTLAGIKVAGHFLELGTGTGISASWIADGMDAQSQLTTVDHDAHRFALAKRFLDKDARVHCVLMDGDSFIQSMAEQGTRFDFIFADMEPGKYRYLDETLALLSRGAIYVVDHMLPQPSWDEARVLKASQLLSTLDQRQDIRLTKLNWSTGIIIAAKVQ
ncbi:MAG: class I SAM-dependent methyltransferase [Chloroflexi bacterium]|nr:class I SAM-dependent methyltransferase [Ktedonobacteraceae bacterium]MBV9706282.1 class I SAM-dependent methyltransferase [Chloroflexota bacterium]